MLAFTIEERNHYAKTTNVSTYSVWLNSENYIACLVMAIVKLCLPIDITLSWPAMHDAPYGTYGVCNLLGPRIQWG